MKPTIPQGTRDFGPIEVRKRQYIINTIREQFEQFGYQPLETPVLENLQTLIGKYGEEGDKLMFKILNNGLSNPDKHTEARTAFEMILAGKNTAKITERALRYDLTIPFARYVVMNQGNLTFPFKRYQIQPVWRADRPQKGRYREFFQCDVDVIGTTSLINEAELTQIYDRVFAQLGFRAAIHINNRKILAGIAQTAGIDNQLTSMTMAIDKLDKIGRDGVLKELDDRGIPHAAQTLIADFLNLTGDNQHIIGRLENLLKDSDIGQKGIAELQTLFRYLSAISFTNPVVLDITLARGLDYYTGTIFEAKALDVEMGSIGGGGRYDDLTGTFGLKGMSGVGVSFGLDRICDVMESLHLFETLNSDAPVKALFINFGDESEFYALQCLQRLRQVGIAAEIYPEKAKLDKQMKFANAKNVPYVVFTGQEEMNSQTVKVKNMATGEQFTLPAADLPSVWQ